MDIPDFDADDRPGSSDGSLPSSLSDKTNLAPAEYFNDRIGDLALFIPVSPRRRGGSRFRFNL